MKYFQQSVKHIFTVFLIIGISYSCGDGGGDDPTPTPTPTPAPDISANFTVNKTKAAIGETLTFTDQSTGSPTSWSWTFAGGSPTSSNNQNPTVSYAEAGTYNVSLTVSNSGSSDTKTENNFITIFTPVSTNFTADKTTITAGDSVKFTDASTGTPTAWEWAFEGGTPASSTEQSPSVTYANPGTYAVTLKSSNDDSEDTETKTGFITVNAPVVSRDFSTLESTLLSKMNTNQVNGMSVFIIKNNALLYQKGFGKANVALNRDVTPQTPFMLGSTSKMVTGIVLMTLFDQGKFKMEDDVNNYLPFSLRNPNFPDDPITMKMVISHSASITDAAYNEIDNSLIYNNDGGDPKRPLGDFLKDVLDASGQFANAGGQSSFTTDKPGTKFLYTNIGSALCGYLAERIAEQDFADYSKSTVFQPLGMNNTSWKLSDFNPDDLAMPYNDDGSVRGHYTFNDYPSGQLRSSAEDMSKLMLMFTQGGTLNGVKVLESSSVNLMITKNPFDPNADPPYGLQINFPTDFNQDEIYGHEGEEDGVKTEFFYNPARNVGVMVTANKRSVDLKEFMNELFKEGYKD